MRKRFELMNWSAGLQLLFLLGLVFLSILFFQLIFSLVLLSFSNITPESANDISTIPAQWSRIMVIFNQVGMFLCPALIFSYLYQKDLPVKYFYATNKGPKFNLIIIFILFIPTAIFSVELFEFLNSEMLTWLPESIYESLQGSREDSNQMLDHLMKDQSAADVVVQFVAIALLPALAEEFFFRGVLMRLFYQFTYNIHTSIFTVALLFAVLHFQFHYLIPMWFMGVMLGYAYYWTGSIWFPVVLHLINNSLAIFGVYFYEATTDSTVSLVTMIFSLILPLVLYLMHKYKNDHSLNTWYKY